MSSANAIVHIEQLSKHFVSRKPLAERWRAPFARGTSRVDGLVAVNARIAEGELFGVLGPNGAGKTTLFRTLATHLTPDEGRASICGHDVQHEAAAVRRLVSCVMANERAMNWRLSARENLRLYAALQRVPRAVTASRIAETLSVVGLDDVSERPVGLLSSGLRQRVLLARGLVARPRVLLLDEPTRSLDPMSARAIRTLVRDVVVRDMGCTVLVATHDGDEAFDWCDRVAVLHQGRVLAVDAADTLAERFGEAVIGVWTTAPDAEAFSDLLREGLVHRMERASESTDAWRCVRLHLPNGFAAAAAVFERLRAHRVPVARFERQDRSLAELIERVVQADVAARGLAS